MADNEQTPQQPASPASMLPTMQMNMQAQLLTNVNGMRIHVLVMDRDGSFATLHPTDKKWLVEQFLLMASLVGADEEKKPS